MGLDMYLSYRRNLDGIPETIQHAMRKQAYTDRYPHLAEHFTKTGELDDIIDYRAEKGDPYEEELMYWRKANAIHKFFVDNAANGVDDCQPVQVTIDVLKDLVDRCERRRWSSCPRSPAFSSVPPTTMTGTSTTSRRPSRPSSLSLNTQSSTRIRSSTKRRGDCIVIVTQTPPAHKIPVRWRGLCISTYLSTNQERKG